MSTKAPMSVAEFDALPEREGWKVELSDGELIMTAAARAFHNLVRDRLGRSLGDFADKHGLGEVLWETDFKLETNTVRIPDVAFISARRWRGVDPRALMDFAPDLAVEVVSPSNNADDLALKVRQYLRAGTRLVWVIYPESRLVYIYRPGERPEIREAETGQVLDAPALLPGWSLPLATLFGTSDRGRC